MKRLFLIMLVLISTVCLVSCGSQEKNETQNHTTNIDNKPIVIKLDEKNYYKYLNINVVEYTEYDRAGRSYYRYRIECDGALDFAIYEDCILNYTLDHNADNIILNIGGFGVSKYLDHKPVITGCSGKVTYRF